VGGQLDGKVLGQRVPSRLRGRVGAGGRGRDGVDRPHGADLHDRPTPAALHHRPGRGLYAVLTDAGEDMLRRMWPVSARVLRETMVEPISADEAATIATGLHRAAAASAT
jgi:hypothetical protein